MVDIEFAKLSYVTQGKHSKKILKSIYGKFSSGSLIGILGPSGAGKTSLLNVLAGQICTGVTGKIRINGKPRDMREFHKMSCYIMQDDVLQKQLTVQEAMTTAIDLKVGYQTTPDNKMSKIRDVLKLIGLEKCRDTRTEHLSGGQRKRLAIALELVSDPPVIFLDEPTTGLDNVVMKQCIELLKSLTEDGRTIICTIHQPSDSIFQLFDQVYFMSDGFCIYNGSVPQMVPFLSAAQMDCPTTHSPADYIIELVNIHEDSTILLSNQIRNGNNSDMKPSNKVITTKTENWTEPSLPLSVGYDFPTSFPRQVSILLSRMMLQLSRNKVLIAIQLIHHVVGSVAMGMSFFGVGNNAEHILANFKMFIGVMLFYSYTHIMSPVLLFPFEIELLKREYFNRWYSLKAYYTAMTISSLPLLIIFGMIFNIIVYVMTDQPMEVMRFVYFSMIGILTALTSYGLGLTIGSIFQSTSGATVGSAVGVCLVLLSMYGMGYGDTIEPYMKFFMFFSYLRHGLVGICCAVLKNRRPFDCDDIFCIYRDPEDLMQLMGMHEASMHYVVFVMVGFLLVLRLTAFVALRRKVMPDALQTIKWL